MSSETLVFNKRDNNFIFSAILCSIVFHFLIVFLCYQSITNYKPSTINDTFFTVELIPEHNKTIRKQIVESENKQDETEHKSPEFEAEKNSFTDKQQVRRGEQKNSSSVIAEPKLNPATEPNKSTDSKKTESLKTENKQPINQGQPQKLKLKLDNSELAFETKRSETNELRAEQNIQQALSRQNQAPLAGGVDVSRIGSRDYLPDLPDGDVTLLNAKANKFAVFVRRVASQVFANLKQSGWHSLSASDIRNIGKEATFEAVLNRQGKLLSVKKLSQSGSNKFDNVLEDSIKRGANDPNPPAGAEAADGLIRFTFEAKSWIEFRPNKRTGNPSQVRWLLLGTGLD